MYHRVIPRDLFNESKLLKCLGQLTLAIHDCQAPHCLTVDEDDYKEFRIDQRQSDGGLYLSQGPKFKIKSIVLELYSRYNSKASFPLMCVTDEDDIEVFDDDGKLSSIFCEYVTSI